MLEFRDNGLTGSHYVRGINDDRVQRWFSVEIVMELLGISCNTQVTSWTGLCSEVVTMLTLMSPACVTEHGLAQPSCTCTFTTDYKHCTGDVIDRVLRSTVAFPVQKLTRNSHPTTTGNDNGSDGTYRFFEKRLLCLDEAQSAHIK